MNLKREMVHLGAGIVQIVEILLRTIPLSHYPTPQNTPGHYIPLSHYPTIPLSHSPRSPPLVKLHSIHPTFPLPQAPDHTASLYPTLLYPTIPLFHPPPRCLHVVELSQLSQLSRYTQHCPALELSSSACVTPARHACVEPAGPHLPSP